MIGCTDDLDVIVRFTSYDFKKMQRRSYYPSNPQLVSQMTATSSTGVDPSRPVTPMTISNDIAPHDSHNGNAFNQKISSAADADGIEYESSPQTPHMHDVNNEKAY